MASARVESITKPLKQREPPELERCSTEHTGEKPTERATHFAMRQTETIECRLQVAPDA